jgi:hypothetical protein
MALASTAMPVREGGVPIAIEVVELPPPDAP